MNRSDMYEIRAYFASVLFTLYALDGQKFMTCIFALLSIIFFMTSFIIFKLDQENK
jgi:uncharacterized membrane protein